MELSYKFSQPILYLLPVDLQVILVIIYTKVVTEKNSRVIKTFHLRLLKIYRINNTKQHINQRRQNQRYD